MSGTITHSWNGTILTVTSDSGTSSADLKGEKGDTGIRGAQGAEGKVDLSTVYTMDNPPTPAEVGAVPINRLINGKLLSEDLTLTAADVGAAPAGYGLGGSGESGAVRLTPDTIDEAVQNGWYAYYDNTWADLAGLSFAGGIFVITRYVGVYQYFFPRWDPLGAGVYAVRVQKDDGSWSEWDVANPPMMLGTEYRTTERYNGKPVYTMLIDGGKLTAGTTTFKHHDLNAHIIRCTGNMSKDGFVTATSIPYSYHDGTAVVSKVTIGSNANSVLVTVEAGSFTDYSFRAQIWYVKD